MRTIIALAVLASATAYAQNGPLNTTGVGIDRDGRCWKQGPANTLVAVTPVLGTAVPITSATQVLTKGTWIIVSGGTATVVVSDGTTQTGVASGNAYPV